MKFNEWTQRRETSLYFVRSTGLFFLVYIISFFWFYHLEQCDFHFQIFIGTNVYLLACLLSYTFNFRTWHGPHSDYIAMGRKFRKKTKRKNAAWPVSIYNLINCILLSMQSNKVCKMQSNSLQSNKEVVVNGAIRWTEREREEQQAHVTNRVIVIRHNSRHRYTSPFS